MRAAAAEQRYERAAWLRRRLRRLRVILERLGGVLEATHARPRLLLVAHPTDARAATRSGSPAAGWWTGGRSPDDARRARTSGPPRRSRAGGRAGELGAHVPPDEIDEVRIVATYLASHPDAPQLALDPPPSREALERFVRRGQPNGSSTTSAVDVAAADATR